MSPLDQARAALGPFAEAFDQFEKNTEAAMTYDNGLNTLRHAVRLTHFRAAAAALARLSALTPPDEEAWAAVIDECIEVERADTVDLETNQVVRINIIKGSREAARTLIGMAGGVK